jgi:hypothetical protein
MATGMGALIVALRQPVARRPMATGIAALIVALRNPGTAVFERGSLPTPASAS